MHRGLGEETPSIIADFEEKGLPLDGIHDGSGPVYLTTPQTAAALGHGVSFDTCDVPHPVDATSQHALSRFVAAVKAIIAETPMDSGDVVLVTHGFAFEALTSHHVPPKHRLLYRDYCGYVIVDRDCEVLDAFGVAAVA